MEKVNENLEEDIFEGIDEEIVEAKKTKPSDQEVSYDMNLQPKSGRWANWRNKRRLKSISRKEERALAKQKEAEKIKNGQISKKDLAKAYGYVVAQGLIAATVVATTIVTASIGVAFVAGTIMTLCGINLVDFAKDARDKHKQYRKENPKTKKVKQKKEKKPKKQKEKKLGLGKRIKNFFTRSKNKTESNNEPIVNEVQAPVNPVDMNIEQTNNQPEMPKPSETTSNYSLDKNGPKIETVDLSNISIKPGLDVNIQHFIVNKEDQIMQDIVSQYIERITGTPAMYADRVIDNEEKRVYMLTR